MPYPKLKLISYAICPFVQRATFLLELKQIPYEVEYIDLSHKPDWFLTLSPTGKVPLLLVDDTVLFESQVIVEYLDEISAASLHPSAPLPRAQQKALIEFSSNMIMTQWRLCIAASQQEYLEHRAMLLSQLERLEQHIQTARFFNGDALSMIDIAAAPLLQRLDFVRRHFEPELFNQVPKLAQWTANLLELPAFKASAVADLEPRILDRIQQNGGVLASA